MLAHELTNKLGKGVFKPLYPIRDNLFFTAIVSNYDCSHRAMNNSKKYWEIENENF